MRTCSAYCPAAQPNEYPPTVQTLVLIPAILKVKIFNPVIRLLLEILVIHFGQEKILHAGPSRDASGSVRNRKEPAWRNGFLASRADWNRTARDCQWLVSAQPPIEQPAILPALPLPDGPRLRELVDRPADDEDVECGGHSIIRVCSSCRPRTIRRVCHNPNTLRASGWSGVSRRTFGSMARILASRSALPRRLTVPSLLRVVVLFSFFKYPTHRRWGYSPQLLRVRSNARRWVERVHVLRS